MLVTGARSSRQQAIDERQRRYIITMSLRSLAFVVAVAFYVLHLPWIALGVLGLSLLAPIFAVIAANDHVRPDEGSAEPFLAGPDTVPGLRPGRTIDL